MTIPRKNYLNNADLLAAVIESKEKGHMTNKLATMLKLLCERYASRGNFAGYTYNEDMRAYSLMQLCKTWNGFDPNKSNNPFAWFTQCIKNSFIQYLKHERKHRDIRDEQLIANGMNPSYTYQVDEHHSNQDRLFGDEQDWEVAVATYVDINRIIDDATISEDPANADSDQQP